MSLQFFFPKLHHFVIQQLHHLHLFKLDTYFAIDRTPLQMYRHMYRTPTLCPSCFALPKAGLLHFEYISLLQCDFGSSVHSSCPNFSDDPVSIMTDMMSTQEPLWLPSGDESQSTMSLSTAESLISESQGSEDLFEDSCDDKICASTHSSPLFHSASPTLSQQPVQKKKKILSICKYD